MFFPYLFGIAVFPLCTHSMIRSLCRVFQLSHSALRFVEYPFSKGCCLRSMVKSFSTKTIDIGGIRASVTKQKGIVRQLKKDGASQEEVTAGATFDYFYYF